MYHSGHRPIQTNEIALKHSELTEEMKNRIIEDAGSAISISTTVMMTVGLGASGIVTVEEDDGGGVKKFSPEMCLLLGLLYHS